MQNDYDKVLSTSKLESEINGTQSDVIPEPKIPSTGRGWWPFGGERDERDQLEKDGSQHHNIRRVAAYGVLLIALLMYAAGLAAIGIFLGLCPKYPPIKAEMWHIVVAVLMALFTVPTVLAISVLKITGSNKSSDSIPSSAQEAIGNMVVKLFDKLSS